MAYQLQVQNINYDPTRFLTRAGEVLERAKNEHRAAEVAYGELSSKADEFEKLANDVRGRDSQAYINYKNYANTLRQHTDMLATQGVNPLLWRNLIQAKNDYARIMQPIEEGWKARDREAQRQAKYLEQHPTAIFEKDARDMGIDEWVRNPHFTSKSIDREVVANRAKERYAALQNQIMEMVSLGHIDPLRMTSKDVKQWVKVNVPWLYESMEKYGVNPDEVKAFMAGDKSTLSSLLNSVARETLGEFGIADWNTDYAHYSAEQNRQRRQNLDDVLVSTVIGEAPNSINTSKFDEYKDDISGDLAYKYAKLAQDKDLELQRLALQNKQFELNKWLAFNNGGKGGGEKDPKMHTYYRDFERIVPHTDVETTKAAQLLALKNLVDREDGSMFLWFDQDEINDASKKIFGTTVDNVDFSDNTNVKKLQEYLYNEHYPDVSSNLIFGSSRTPEESQQMFYGMAADKILESQGENVSKPLTQKGFEELMGYGIDNLSYSDLLRAYDFIKNKKKDTQSYINSGQMAAPVVDAINNNFNYMSENKDLDDEDYRNLAKAVAVRGAKELKKNNPYNKAIDDLIGTKDNDIFDYATRVNNYIKGATTAYLGAEDNFTGQSVTTQSELLWGQSLSKATDEGISVNLHTLDEKGNKVNVPQNEIVEALGINKNGEITRPYRVSIIPVEGKDGRITMHPMIITEGYTDGSGNFIPGKEFEWNHTSVRENAPQRTEHLRLMNIELNKLEQVKKSPEFRKIVADADKVVDAYIKREQSYAAQQGRTIEDTPYLRQSLKTEYLTKALQDLQRPYLESYVHHKSEFMRLWSSATHNTRTQATDWESNTGDYEVDPKRPKDNNMTGYSPISF